MSMLIEANLFAKLLSFFFSKRDRGQEDDVVKILKKTTDNPAYNAAYDAWAKDSEALLLATKRMLQKNGLDTDDVDAMLTKYHNK